MSKPLYQNFSKKDQEFFLDAMFKAVADLKSAEDVKKFFYDLLTANEKVMIGRRVLVAELLLKGSTFFEIIKELKVGKDTISRVDNWLVKGFGPYRHKVKGIRQEKGFVDYGNYCPLSFDGLANKYPAHFWLLKLLVDMGRKGE